MKNTLPWLILVALLTVIILSIMSINNQAKLKNKLHKRASLEDDTHKLLSDYLDSVKETGAKEAITTDHEQ